MTTVAPHPPTVATSRRRRTLRAVVAGAAPFDGLMGVGCLAAGSAIGTALSVGVGPVRVTGGLFLAAAFVGAATLRRPEIGLRWIVGANTVFALWCLAVLGFAGPNAAGTALLALSAAASGGTAVLEQRLAASPA